MPRNGGEVRVNQHSGEFAVETMCRFMKVSRSAYYAWLQRPESAGEKADVELTELIKTAFAKSRATYGTRRLKVALFQRKRSISRRRIGPLMRQADLTCKTKRKFKATTNSQHDLPVADNMLDRQFKVMQPNQVYAGDITYITTEKGWLYLAVVIDLCSRQVIGWSMAEHMRAELINERSTDGSMETKPDKGLLWHTDRQPVCF